MEEIYYKKNLADLTNRQLVGDFEDIFIEDRLENYPEGLEEHHEILSRANPEDRVEPAESRNILFNYMQDFFRNKQSVSRRRLRGGKKSKRRKSRKSRRGRKTKRSKITRRR
jgi:hypothetical protein